MFCPKKFRNSDWPKARKCPQNAQNLIVKNGFEPGTKNDEIKSTSIRWYHWIPSKQKSPRQILGGFFGRQGSDSEDIKRHERICRKSTKRYNSRTWPIYAFVGFPIRHLGDMFSWLLMPMVFSPFRYLYEMEMENILVHKQAGAPTTYISARRRIVSTPIHFGAADMNKRMKRGALASGRR